MPIASFNLDFNIAVVCIGAIVAVAVLIATVRSGRWSWAIVGTSLAWATIGFLMVGTASGDMAVPYMMAVYAVVFGVAGGVMGAVVRGVIWIVSTPDRTPDDADPS